MAGDCELRINSVTGGDDNSINPSGQGRRRMRRVSVKDNKLSLNVFVVLKHGLTHLKRSCGQIARILLFNQQREKERANKMSLKSEKGK